MIYTGVFYKFGIYPVIWNKLYKREKLIKHQMAVDDDIRTGEDAACVYPYLLECDSLYFLENLSLYHYRRSRTQMTVSYDSSYFDCFKSLYEFLSSFINRKFTIFKSINTTILILKLVISAN